MFFPLQNAFSLQIPVVGEELVLQNNKFYHLFWISANMEMCDMVWMFFYSRGMLRLSKFH